jgi:hypothetical protein
MAKVLERGNIYFAYRPRVEEDTAGALEDIQRFFMILSPYDSQQYRLLVVGRKRLPRRTSATAAVRGQMGIAE